MKKTFFRILVVVISTVLIFSPFLLVIDMDKFLPVFLLIWMLSVSYFLFIVLKK